MKNKIASISFSLIRHLGKEISNGRPIWALLFLSEYSKEKDRPLLDALKKRALGKILNDSRYQSIQPLYSRLMAGETLNHFSAEEQSTLRSFESVPAKIEKAFVMPVFSSKREFPRRAPTIRQRPSIRAKNVIGAIKIG